jgi:hypothetical protein
MKSKSKNNDCDGPDRIEGKVIILHDTLPEGWQDLWSVVIIKGRKTRNYTIRRSKKENYLFQ